MQTFKRVTALLMVLIMMLSAMSLSLIASAVEINTAVVFNNQVNSITQGTVTNTGNANTRNAKAVVDYLDQLLAELNIKTELDLKVATLEIDATSVDNLLETVDMADSIIGGIPSFILRGFGSLKDLNFKNWKSDQSRAKTGDDAILKNLIQFLYDNRNLLADVVDGSFTIGSLDSVLGIDADEGKTILWMTGALKNEETGEVYAYLSDFLKDTLGNALEMTVTDSTTLDDIVVAALAKYLPGFTLTNTTTSEELILGVVNSVWATYVTPNVTKIVELKESIGSNAYTAPLANLVNFDVTGEEIAVTFNSIEDVNNAIGKVVAAATTYTGWQSGTDLALVSTNVVNAIKWVFDNADTSASADDVKAKYATWAEAEADDAALLAVVKLVVNAAWPEYAATVDNQTTVEGALIAVLTKLIAETPELSFAVIGKNSKTAEKFLGDFAGSFLAQYIPLRDANGKNYVVGSGTDVYTVANYALNYFLVDLNLDALLGLTMTKGQSLYAKLEAMQKMLFGSIAYVKASEYIPSLVENVLNLDIGKLFSENVEPIIEDYKGLSACDLVYTVIYNVTKSIFGTQILASDKFTTFEAILRSSGATTDDNLGTLVANLLAGLENRKADFLPIVYYAYNALLTDKTYTVSGKAANVDLAKSLAQSGVVVKYGDEVLKENVDYKIVYANGGKKGTTTATVQGIGNYAGTVELGKVTISCSHKKVTQKAVAATYTKAGKTQGSYCSVCGQVFATQKTVAKLTLGKVSGLKAKKIEVAKSSSITLAWNKVTGAQKYEVYQKSGKKWKKLTTTSKTSYTVKKLKAGKTYEFRVRAVRPDDKVYGAYATVEVKVAPSAPSLTVKAGKKQLTASWKSVSGASGYEVQYSTSKKFTKKTTKTVSAKKSAKKTTIKKLKKGKKYYVRVRTYKTVNGKKVYSSWSTVKNVKVK